ncbi:hypothetical protein RN001_007343 [Aquatica leii]|uniref:Replication factor C subunit 1 n=1 Tax=Aquatica leii TaxID=1421715 RepID=A0AAN7SFB4_9COLE|nr:hypothetical protein RN001_007343 [Aquatica leii]
MSKDIRSFFQVLSTKKSTSTSPSKQNKTKKRPVIESSDEDVIPDTPKTKKIEKPLKKRKAQAINSGSDDDIKVLKKQSKHEEKKPNLKQLKPVDVTSTFGDKPIKQTPVPEKRPKSVVTPEKSKKKVQKNEKSKAKVINTELGIHNDKNFEKSLLDLDEDFLIENVDELDKTIDEALKTYKEETKVKNSTPLPKSVKEDSAKLHDTASIPKTPKTPKTTKTNKEVEPSESDPDQERYERKRHSAVLYQKYLNRSGPAHHGCKELPKGKPGCLKNLCFLRTGVLDSLTNEEFETLIKDYEGRVVHGVSKKVNYIVVGEEAGPAKLEKAKNYGIKLLTEDELLDLIKVKSGLVTKDDTAELKDNITKVEKVQEKSNDTKGKVKEKKSPKQDTKSVNQTIAKPESKPKVETVKTGTSDLSVKVTDTVQIKDDNNNLPWTEKYKPSSVKNIIGQQTDKSNVKKLLFWLENWFKNHSNKDKPKVARPSPWAKNDDGSFFKAALLSGPPGIGKTTTATLVAKELGFDVVEFNASDTRSKKLLHEEVSQLLTTKSLAGYFNGGTAPTNKHVLLMDEVDGMAGNEDRGGVQELITLIKNSNIPVICMCNDRNHPKIRSLSNYCFDLRFARPRMEQIRGAMMSVCFREGVKISPENLSEIINSAGMDIRQVLTHLSLWTAEKKTSGDKSEDIKGPKKDTPLGPWEVCRKVFSAEDHKSSNIGDRERLFYHDYNIGPLFVQENYLKVMPHASKKDHLKLFADAASSISMGDLVDSKIRSSNNWSLLNLEAMCLSVLPGTYLSGHVNAQIDFPNWLGKNSKKNKFTRLLGELQAHMRTSISGNRSEVNLDYISPLRKGITEPLAKRGTDGVDQALDVMHTYNLLREDLDSILELAHWPRQKDPMSMVDSKVKAAFTRSYNKVNAKLPYAIHSNVSKKKGTATSEDLYGVSDEEEPENSDSEEKDITKDAMIKPKKASTKVSKKDEPSTSSNKRSAKGGSSRAKKIKK